MPVQLTVRVEASKAKKLAGDLAGDVQRSAGEPIRKMMYRALARIIAYPEPFKGPYPWKSDKQRRYVMAMIRKGVIKVPYERTYRYHQGWKVKAVDEGRTGYRLTGRAVQKGKDYTKWVGGSARGGFQARIHKGRWALARQVIDEETEKLPEQVRQVLRKMAKRVEAQP